MLPDFNDEFASPADYAGSIAILACRLFLHSCRMKPRLAKRPYLQEWKQYSKKSYHRRFSMDGMERQGDIPVAVIWVSLLASVRRRIIVIDLDTHKNRRAQLWWDGIHADHNAGIMSECPTQRTGGGGFQMFFSCA